MQTNNDTITVTKDQVAEAFRQWDEDYKKSADDFETGKDEGRGDSAEYFFKLLADKSNAAQSS